jgi:HPt (histidine-containing phosphotransfer) domain-containing protein
MREVGSEVLNPERLESLRELCDGEDDLVVEIAALYLEELPEVVAGLGAAAAARDLGVTRDFAHKIKGASANVGADSLAALCGQIEVAAVAGSTEEVDDLVAQLHALFPRVCDALAAELPGAGPR